MTMNRKLTTIILMLFVSSLIGIACADNKTIELSPGNSKVLKTSYKIRKAALGNPDIADIVPSERELIINSKKPGITTLTLWDEYKDYNYTILVSKGTSKLYVKAYKLNNISLVDNKPKWDSVERSIIKDSYDSIYKMIKNTLTDEQFAISPYSSSVLVYGSDGDHRRIEELIATLDRKTKTVIYKASIYEVTLENSFIDEFNLSYKRNNIKDENGTQGQSYNYTIGNNLSYNDILTNPAKAAAYYKEVSLFIKKLETAGNAKLVANPQLQALENNPAVINAGDRIPIISFDKDGNPSTTYVNTGTNLLIVGSVDETNTIYCSLRAEYSQISGWQEAVGPGGVKYAAPIISNRTAANNGVRIMNNETFFLGGLMREKENTNISKVPVLGDILGWIPFIGGLFKNETKTFSKTELVITITPEIIETKISDESKG